MFFVKKNLLSILNINNIDFSPARIIVLGFIGLILIGTLLLSLPISAKSGEPTYILDALFTSTSAVCVTGLVIVDTGTYWSDFGQFVIIMLVQAGGLGTMSLATLFFILMRKDIGLRERLTLQESLNSYSLQGIVKMLRKMVAATFIIEFAGALILSIRFIPMFGFAEGIKKSIFHAISAFCNAGFDTFGTPDNKFVNLVNFYDDPLVLLTISTLLILGGIGFIVLFDIIEKRRFSKFLLQTKVVIIMTAILLVTGTIFILAAEYNNPATLKNMPVSLKLLNAYFHSASPRTAGFNSLPIADMTEASKFLTVILMFIGASSGSIAGGIKITTFAVAVLAVVSFIRGQDSVSIFGRTIGRNIIFKSFCIIALSSVLVILTTTVLLINNEGSLMQSLYEATSAFGTVGLTTGITPNLNTVSKLAIALTMFAGRVGPISFLVAFTFNKNKKLFNYPEGKITVG